MEYWKNLSLENLSCWHDGVFYIEEWRTVVGYDFPYTVSNFGRIKSPIIFGKFGTRNGIRKQKIRKQFLRPDGDLHVSFKKGGKQSSPLVHVLIASAFIQNIEKKQEVNHLDGARSNNLLFNLEWNTPIENQQHSIRMGRKYVNGSKIGTSKLTEDAVSEMKEMFRSGNHTQVFIAKKFGVSDTHASRIKKGEIWKQVL